MRLFIAAELPDEMLAALAETSAALRAQVRGRYVAPDSLHVTLAFLGQVAGSRVTAVQDALERACAGHAPMRATLGELGSFGRSRTATLWQGFAPDEGRQALVQLAGDVRRCLQGEGFSFDAKAFVPHVTLMRAARLDGGVLPPANQAMGVIEAVTLFESDLSGARPVYEALHRVFLESAPR